MMQRYLANNTFQLRDHTTYLVFSVKLIGIEICYVCIVDALDV